MGACPSWTVVLRVVRLVIRFAFYPAKGCLSTERGMIFYEIFGKLVSKKIYKLSLKF